MEPSKRSMDYGEFEEDIAEFGVKSGFVESDGDIVFVEAVQDLGKFGLEVADIGGGIPEGGAFGVGHDVSLGKGIVLENRHVSSGNGCSSRLCLWRFVWSRVGKGYVRFWR